MNLQDINIKNEYRSFTDNMVNDFYIPVLEKAVRYDRAVGFFSSTALIEITRGLAGLIRNKGKVRIIASPRLSEEDIEAIHFGYKSREEVIEEKLLVSLNTETDYFAKKRLNLLANLISDGVIDIKIALIKDNKSIGIFHEKMGIVEDSDGHKIAFSGSLNETGTAFSHNYESIDVFRSWTHEKDRVEAKDEAFDQIWNSKAKNIETIDFPDIAKEKLESYKVEEIDLVLDAQEEYVIKSALKERKEINGPIVPDEVHLREYQLEAIKKWEIHGYNGVFDMATGTGKTITGLGAVAELAKSLRYKLAVVIVCPYQHLVDQWVEDIELFNMKPIVAHSASKQKSWKKRLEQQIESFNLEVTDHFCLVTTNATFSSDYVQKLLKSVKGNLLLMVDEAHNFGAEHLQTKLLPNAHYRLALSATINRHNDEEGTQSLFNYFGEKCIEYTLEMAINNGMLTPYYYHPIPVFLTPDELLEYQELTSQIAKAVRKDKSGKVTFSESAKFLLLKRARIVAGAQEKILKLENEIKKYKDDSHILVYCGATTINDPDYREGSSDEEERRQIDVVTNLLGNKLDFKVSKFTSEEPAEEREELKKAFSRGDHLQSLIAIRCLDEGVNIPSIKTAFILASSTNPKEYIQRRGRVLRKFKGKKHAVIYDFITLPLPFELIGDLSPEEIQSMQSLPLREIERMKDFAAIAENSSVADTLISEIKENYNLNKEEEEYNEFI
ncbi:DEAD/DEAH box helicase family protein [Planococcus sp. 1R117A]|uniref:DEAD/DEAH box helicase family protein n=1 Tax=Planococcus sp. 1R117A TaxID=3447020 RepID=UPI003EDBB4F6